MTDPDRLHELCRLRSTLEAFAVRRWPLGAARLPLERELSRRLVELKQLAAAGDYEAFHAADREFHRAAVEAAGSPAVNWTPSNAPCRSSPRQHLKQVRLERAAQLLCSNADAVAAGPEKCSVSCAAICRAAQRCPCRIESASVPRPWRLNFGYEKHRDRIA